MQEISEQITTTASFRKSISNNDWINIQSTANIAKNGTWKPNGMSKERNQ